MQRITQVESISSFLIFLLSLYKPVSINLKYCYCFVKKQFTFWINDNNFRAIIWFLEWPKQSNYFSDSHLQQ